MKNRKTINWKDNPKFAVVGAGAGGLAMAAHLSILGYNVNLYNRGEKRIRAIKEQKGIESRGVIAGFAKMDKITNRADEAIKDADIIMIVVPAFAHKDIAKTLSPYLKDGQIIVLNPGRTGGAIEFANTLIEENIKKEIIIAETQTILHTCRVIGNEVVIIAVKKKVLLSAFPGINTDGVITILSEIFPQFVKGNDVLQTGLNNVGCILHPLPTLFNIGWIETPKTAFKYYYEGITPSISRILELIDQERMSVARSFGVNVISTREWLFETYGAKGETLYETLQNNEYYKTIDAPDTIRHRYLFEDVPTGLVPISSLGALVGVNTPVMNQIIDLASLICNVDFRKTGRTPDNLGLSDMNVKQLRELVRYGIKS